MADYTSWKVPELKEELKKMGLPTSGKKEDLLERLKTSLASNGSKKHKNDEVEKSGSENEESPKAKKQKTSTTAEEKGEEEAPKKETAAPKAKVQGTLAGFIKSPAKKAETSSEAEAPANDGLWTGILSNLTEPGWRKVLASEINKPSFKKTLEFLDKEKKRGAQIFPPENEIFSAFNYTPFDKLKVVIIGQDPYHDDNQAHGMCFSVKKGINPPPSLKNIYKELTTDIPGFKAPNHGFLGSWAKEGILLLNATLTVEAHKANSHSKESGWMNFTDGVIKLISDKKKGIVFILWGKFAQQKGKLIDGKKHHIINAAHPSPLSVKAFLGCKVFSKTNSYLEKEGLGAINWQLPMSADE
eukprot:TRINITY_DN5586_c0_g1_i1.p1 TRINITY_DN5586_c0_g1~~TRINITY_DN5586_c0_g1_i1.p1  ORF type:complete len:381 (+),score=103.88 TRINITY_DN5586_c0_g1_i1:75-1145(+)